MQTFVPHPVEALDPETRLAMDPWKESGIRNIQSSFPSHERVGVFRFSGVWRVNFCRKFDKKMSISQRNVRDTRHHVTGGRVKSDKDFRANPSRRSSKKEELGKDILRASFQNAKGFISQFLQINLLANLRNHLVFRAIDKRTHSPISDESEAVKGANAFPLNSHFREMAVHQEKSPSVRERVEEHARETKKKSWIPALYMFGQWEA